MKVGINVVVVSAIFVSVIALLVCGIVHRCSAQDDDRTALALVQCLRAECETCQRDQEEKAAIAWVLQKRAEQKGISLYRQIKGYCAVFGVNNPRAIEITLSTFDTPLRGSHKWWRKMRKWALSFIRGEVEDPEPYSHHWGCFLDTHRMQGRMLLRSFCDENGQRCNHIWGAKTWQI